MWGLTPGNGGGGREGEGRKGGKREGGGWRGAQEELRWQHSAETVTARLLCDL